MSDWTVHFSDPGGRQQQMSAPWDPGRSRVASSGLIYLKGVAARLKDTTGPAKKTAEPRAMITQAGVLRAEPAEEARPRRFPWFTVLGMVSMLGVGLVVGLFGRIGGSDGAVSKGGTQQASAPSPGVVANPTATAKAEPVGTPRAAKSAVTPPPTEPRPTEPGPEKVAPSPEAARPSGATPPSDHGGNRREYHRAAHGSVPAPDTRPAAIPSAQDALQALSKRPAAQPPGPSGTGPAAGTPSGTPPAVTLPTPPPMAEPPYMAPDDKTADIFRKAFADEPMAPELPEKLTSGQLRSHALALVVMARACVNTHGVPPETLMVHLEISGPTGRVADARVAGRFGTMPIGHCLVRSARMLSFPKFLAKRQTLVVPITGR